VSSGSARRGRRENGFDAAEYAVAGDVDPRVGEHLLDVLALQGIAAYLQPAVDLNPVTRSAIIPTRPTDRLFVDRDHLETAKDYLAQLAESPPTGPAPASGAGSPQVDAASTPIPPSIPASPADPFATDVAADQPADPTRDATADRAADGTGAAARSRPDPSGTGPPGRPTSGANPDAGAESDSAIDEAWARIVAGYHTQVDSTAAAWPEVENVPADPTADPGTSLGPRRSTGSAPDSEADDDDTGHDDGDSKDAGQGDIRAARHDLDRLSLDRLDEFDRPDSPVEGWRRPARGNPRDSETSLLDGLDSVAGDLPADDDEGYTPPPPPPLPRISKYAVLGVLGIIVGFVLFLSPGLLPVDNDVSMLLGFTAILAGFLTLIWRLRPDDDEDDYDPDDGARV
jgi:hypothetical protein